MTAPPRTVSLTSLGCARNDVDSEELAARLAAAGWQLTEAPEADVAVVNTCGFVEMAKKDSVDTLLELADLRDDAATRTQAVVAVGCLAQRYGDELATALPEADAVLGFDSYPDLAAHLESVLAGHRPAGHTPVDRRRLLPMAPAARRAAASSMSIPGISALPGVGDTPGVAAPASGPPVLRRRLDDAPWAPLKIASGCDRRCTFCAIPAFRGSMVSRPPVDVVAEAQWLAEGGVREVFLVSENTTSYGKDFGDLHALESLLPRVAAVAGIDRVRVSYLQPAEIRPGTLEAIAGVGGVADYFDLSFQHAAAGVLRSMRRFGDADAFLGLIRRIRELAPRAGIRTNVIVGFPGETEDDLAVLHDFLAAAEVDVVGVFGYSDEDGTAAADLPGKHDDVEVAARVNATSILAEHLTDARAAARVGEPVVVLVEHRDEDDRDVSVGRAEHQGPEVDGVVRLTGHHPSGTMVRAVVVDSQGVDLSADPICNT